MRKIGIILLVVMFIFLYGCMQGQNITISFETNGGSLIEDIKIDSSLIFVLSEDPVKEGYEFAGWYSDVDLTEVYDFKLPPEESKTLYADWGTIGLEYELINNDTEYSVSKGTANTLTEIQIPNIYDGKAVVEIKQQGFLECRDLESITIPNSIEKIGREAFKNCDNLEGIFISSGVTEIEDFAFQSCISLTELIIPMSVEIVGEGIVFGTSNLETIYVESLSRPNGWNLLWNSTLKPVFWGYPVIPDTKPIITIVPAMEYLVIGRTTQIIPTITNTTDERLTWSSSNTRAATVDILGIVRGLDFGTTVITVTSVADPTVSATVEIQVTMEGSGALRVTATKTVLAIDNLNEQLSVSSAWGTYLDLSECTFTSDDPSIVTITSDGIIQPHSRGTTTIQVNHFLGIGVIKLTVVD